MGSTRSLLYCAILLSLSVLIAGCGEITGDAPKIAPDDKATPAPTTSPAAVSKTQAAPAATADSGWSGVAGNVFQTTVPSSISHLAAKSDASSSATVQPAEPAGGPPALSAPDPAFAESSSLYLRQASSAPVFWRMWAPEAFAEAERRGVPTIIVIGTAWSHEARVMDADVFSQPDISKALNENFVPIRVDADERPDIWSRYRLAYEMINKQRARPPLTVFAMPDGRPYDVIGMVQASGDGENAGMKELLEQATAVMKNQPQEVAQQAASIEEVLEKLLTEPRVESVTLSAEVLETMGSELQKASTDEQSESLRAGRVADFLMYLFGAAGSTSARDAGSELLLSRFRSGQRDHVLGGYFFRVPANGGVQFGKILPVQAEMISANAHAFAATGKGLHEEGVTEVLRFCRDSLEAQEGGFYSGQSPDIGSNDNGGYFTWTQEEIKQIVNDDAAATVFIEYLNAEAGQKSNLHVTGRLQQAADAAGVSYQEANNHLNSVRMKLRDARMGAEQVPLVDKSMLAAWNGDMICAYLDAAEFVNDSKAREFALKTADRIIESMVSEQEGVARVLYKGRAGGFGFLEDNVKVAAALIRCYKATNQAEYLDSAKSLMEYVEARFIDKNSGLYQDVASDTKAPPLGLLKLKRLPLEDDISRSANAVAAMVWFQLAQEQESDKNTYKLRAERMVKAALERRPFTTQAVTTWGQAAVLLQHGTPQFKR